MGRATVTVRLPHLDANQVQLSMPDTPFSNDLLGELAYLLNGAFKHHGLDALVMIEMGVHG